MAKISTNGSSMAPRSKKDAFALNVKLLEDEDVLSAWVVDHTSVVDRWVQNTKSWRSLFRWWVGKRPKIPDSRRMNFTTGC